MRVATSSIAVSRMMMSSLRRNQCLKSQFKCWAISESKWLPLSLSKERKTCFYNMQTTLSARRCSCLGKTALSSTPCWWLKPSLVFHLCLSALLTTGRSKGTAMKSSKCSSPTNTASKRKKRFCWTSCSYCQSLKEWRNPRRKKCLSGWTTNYRGVGATRHF